jgi:hypothetical protein
MLNRAGLTISEQDLKKMRDDLARVIGNNDSGPYHLVDFVDGRASAIALLQVVDGWFALLQTNPVAVCNAAAAFQDPQYFVQGVTNPSQTEFDFELQQLEDDIGC